MNKDQMEMLSVKNAIERMVQNYIDTFKTVGSHKEFFTAVERLVASFYVGQQIDNNYLVRSLNNGDLEIRFTTRKQGTRITFMLPEQLKWKIDTRKPQVADENPKEEQVTLTWDGDTKWASGPEVEAGTIHCDVDAGKVLVYDGDGWVSMNPDVLRDTAGVDVRDVVLEGTIRVGKTGALEVYQNGKWIQMPQHRTASPSTPQPEPVAQPETEEFDPFEAYERAKKAVKNMA